MFTRACSFRYVGEEGFSSSVNQPPPKEYENRVILMNRSDKTTLEVDFTHVNASNHSLAEVIEKHYYRCCVHVCVHIASGVPGSNTGFLRCCTD